MTVTDRDKPLVDRSASAVGVRRLLLLGGLLMVLAGSVSVFGHAFGALAVFAIFAVLACVGIAAIFLWSLGFVQFAERAADGSIAREFLDTASTGLIIVDRKGRVIYANQAYGDLTGSASPADVRSLERILSREPDASEPIYRLANLARGSGTGSEEFRLSRGLAANDKGARYYRVWVRPLGAASQGMQAWQIADVTADREQQELSFQELQHAIDYLDHAPAGFIATDERLTLAYVNATLADWLGIELGDFRAGKQSILDLVSDESRPLLDAGFDPATQPPVVDVDLLRADGQVVPVRLIRSAATGVSAAPGAWRAIVIRRGAEGQGAESGDAAETALARFHRFFNASPMAIAALDANGRTLRANAAFSRLFGKDCAGGLAPVVDSVSSEMKEALTAALKDAVRGKGDIPTITVDIPGEPARTVRLYLSSLPERSGADAEAAYLYGIDITEQRALEEQFAKSQKMQAVGNLAGGIAHDFNNVLTIITASVDFLLLNHRQGDPSYGDLILIKQSANRAASLVRQLLAYSRRQTMRPKMLNLTDVIADMHLLLKRVSGDFVKLERRHARDLWPVMADIGQFEQVVTNLVGNARDAMPEGGTITISTRNVEAKEVRGFGYPELSDDDYVLVEVADTGTGMAPEVAERIFEPFFTTKEIGKGTGLGLSMVDGIVKQSGGFIFVDSKLGEGTVFRIFLPRHVPAALPAAASQAGGAIAKGDGQAATAMSPGAAGAAAAKLDLSGTETILLVEDEDHVRAGNVRALKMRGYDVHEAASGTEALEIMRSLGGKVDLVVSDVMMPEMDGPTLLKEMRREHPQLKFIFVSGYAEDAFSRNLAEDETFDFLAKPFTLRELAVAVKGALTS